MQTDYPNKMLNKTTSLDKTLTPAEIKRLQAEVPTYSRAWKQLEALLKKATP